MEQAESDLHARPTTLLATNTNCNQMTSPNVSSTVGTPASQLSPSPFSYLYPGSVCHVHSYLTMVELLLLSRVSHYYRNVATGAINPSGIRSEKVSFVSMDAIQIATTQSREDDAASSSVASVKEDVGNISFASLADTQLQEIASKRVEEGLPSLSPSEIVALLALNPAPMFGCPSAARHRTLVVSKSSFHLRMLDRLLLHRILARHLQSLTFALAEDIHQEMLLEVVSARLPFLRELVLTSCDADAENNADDEVVLPSLLPSVLNNLLSSSKTVLPRLPAQLRSLYLHIYNYDHVYQIRSLLPLLPTQCPLLEKMTITFAADMSPLLQLQNLTHLIVKNPYWMGQAKEDMESVIQQLKLKSLQFDAGYLRDNFPFDNIVEEYTVPWRCTTDDLKQISNQLPSLRSLCIPGSSLIDHSVLLRWPLLHSLKCGQKMNDQEINKPYEDRSFLRSKVLQECVQAHGSLQEHMDHVIANIAQLRCLTSLTLTDFYTRPSSRSCHVNSCYFKSHQMECDYDRHVSWDKYLQTAEIGNEKPLDSNGSSSSSSECAASSSSLSASHSIFKLTARLPSLVKLTLTDDAAYHLPSLAFIHNLPQLQSLSLTRARYLPIESLMELKHVPPSLTHLQLIGCFPYDSFGRSVYLLHDVLQMFQFSQPLTQAVTIKFPAETGRVSEKAIKYMELHQQISMDTPPPAHAGSFVINEESFMESDGVPLPRHSSWYPMERFWVPTVERSAIPPLAELEKAWAVCNPGRGSDCGEVEDRWRRLKIQEHNRRNRDLFDSFTAIEPTDSQSDDDHVLHLISRLNPRLSFIDIQHIEGKSYKCSFVYDRSQTPIYRVRVSHVRSQVRGANWKAQLHADRERMLSQYGVNLNGVTEMESWTYQPYFEQSPKSREEWVVGPDDASDVNFISRLVPGW